MGNSAGLIFLFPSEKRSPECSAEQNYLFKDQKDRLYLDKWCRNQRHLSQEGNNQEKTPEEFPGVWRTRLCLVLYQRCVSVCCWAEAKPSSARPHDFGLHFFTKIEGA